MEFSYEWHISPGQSPLLWLVWANVSDNCGRNCNVCKYWLRSLHSSWQNSGCLLEPGMLLNTLDRGPLWTILGWLSWNNFLEFVQSECKNTFIVRKILIFTMYSYFRIWKKKHLNLNSAFLLWKMCLTLSGSFFSLVCIV